MKHIFGKDGVIVPVLVTLLVAGAFFLGSLYTKVQMLEKGTPQGTAQAPTAPGQPVPSAAPAKVSVDIGKLPIKGNKNAKVTLIEFADFRCPFCERFYTQTESQIMKEYVDTGKVKFAFRNYAFLGPASTVAANAAECANEQNKFWDMYEYFYKNQPPETDTSMYTTDTLTKAAGTLGMDTAKFRSCLSGNKFDANVNGDFTAGQNAGVTGTPTFFVNGTMLVGAQPYSAFKAAIDAELAR
ncbi:DsbA family protein [Patescibacteria group bacterium]|nr:DsbA family protein [Patescibacteria group bacterium]